MTELVTTCRRLEECDLTDRDRRKLLRYLGKINAADEPLPLLSILDASGLTVALVCLGAVDGYHNAMRLYACQCARRVLPYYERRYPGDPRLVDGLDTAERHARGQATDADLKAANAAVWSAWDAIGGATNVFISAEHAAWATVWAVRPVVSADGCATWAATYAERAATWSDTCAPAIRALHQAAERNWQTAEFRRLCRLEGIYGEVAP